MLINNPTTNHNYYGNTLSKEGMRGGDDCHNIIQIHNRVTDNILQSIPTFSLNVRNILQKIVSHYVMDLNNVMVARVGKPQIFLANALSFWF